MSANTIVDIDRDRNGKIFEVGKRYLVNCGISQAPHHRDIELKLNVGYKKRAWDMFING